MDDRNPDTRNTDRAYARLRELIMDAVLLPNTHHLATTLAEKFSLDIDDIQSVLPRLAGEGLVQPEPHGGFWISPLGCDAVSMLYGQVSTLEAQAAFTASVVGVEPLTLRMLDDSVRTMEDAIYRNDNNRWARANHHFHRSLVQASNDTKLAATVLALSDRVHRARMITLAVQPPPFDSAENNAQVVDAIRRGAAEDARDQHLRNWHNDLEATKELLRLHGLDHRNGHLPEVVGF